MIDDDIDGAKLTDADDGDAREWRLCFDAGCVVFVFCVKCVKNIAFALNRFAFVCLLVRSAVRRAEFVFREVSRSIAVRASLRRQ
jgi:hypothetical protein